jgi:tRNA-2-methylthio-N6-dimethylallyladenosine synthase
VIKKVYIKTFGCAQNVADSERVKAYYWEKGYEFTNDWKEADEVIINSCVVRESAENRVYGLLNSISNFKFQISKPKVILTGCLVGVSKKQIKGVDEIKSIKEFETLEPIRDKKKAALIPIASGCDNFCSYCIVPFARGREVSRKMEDILLEVDGAVKQGFKEVVLIGQNVNSWNENKFYGLLEEVAKKPIDKISFVSSNPWDFSDELIEVIAKYPNIDRLIHLPFQSGDDEILKKMNRNYTQKIYLDLVKKIKSKVKNVRFSTDIIIGFPGETEKAFQNTVDVCKKVGFEIAYLNKYSPRRGTVSAKLYKDDIPQSEKKRRWKVLEELVNKKT